MTNDAIKLHMLEWFVARLVAEIESSQIGRDRVLSEELMQKAKTYIDETMKTSEQDTARDCVDYFVALARRVHGD